MDTRELFARLIQCEAGGEGYNGMQAVATVIMNRATITYGEFARINDGGNIRNVIEQQNQFTCMKTSVGGYYNSQNVYNMTPTDVQYEIVDWAMAGGRLAGIDHSLFFYNPYSSTCATYFPTRVGVIHNRLGDHCFYIPTSYYAST
ncbi:MAG: cell wall hydrolase [Bacillota bacterium]|nr:cell wall hydrolase [Bacillota bacterium]